MADIWFISDTHFNHEDITTKFMREDGTPARPFSTVEEMNEMRHKERGAENGSVLYHCLCRR